MANLQRLLGTMLSTGVGGRSRRGPAFASSLGGLAQGGAPAMGARGGGMGFGQKAGLAALGYLAYRAYKEHQSQGKSAGTSADASGQQGGGQSLGDRLGGMLGMGAEPEQPAPEAELGDEKALLLIRAMVAAANADGEISADERQRILGKLDEAEAGPEERKIVEQELAHPRSVDDIARQVHDRETAEQVYVASSIAMNPDTPAEQAYLQYLASRLELPPERTKELHSVV